MAYLSVDIDLGELSDNDLISELETRGLNREDKIRLLELVTDVPDYSNDAAKIKLFLEIKNKFSLLELEAMFGENLSVAEIPKEQLKLAL